MSTSNFIGGHERIAYTIEHRGSCVLITGAVPLGAMGALCQLAPKNAVMDADAATVLGVTFAIGLADDLRALRAAATPSYERTIRQQQPRLSEAAIAWLAKGERGMSSEAMFERLTGEKCTRESPSRDARTAHPYDPDDLRRCRLLLEWVPELQPLLPSMAKVSPAWAGLVEAWDDICATMDAECPDWRNPRRGSSAPKTYQLIKQAIGR